jgi:WD40 repeat protein
VLPEESVVHTLLVSPCGRTLAVSWTKRGVWQDSHIGLWDAARGEPAGRLDSLGDGVYWLTFSPDGRRLASSGVSGVIRVFDCPSLVEVETPPGHRGRLDTLALSPDGRVAATAGSDGTIRVWEVESGRPGAVVATGESALGSITFTADGGRLRGVVPSGHVVEWDAATGAVTGRFGEEGPGFAHRVALSRGGERLARIRSKRLPEVVAVDDGALLYAPSASHELPEDHMLDAVALSPDGRRVAWVHRGIQVRDVATGGWIPVFAGARSADDPLAFSGDGRYLAATRWGETARVAVWDFETREEVCELVADDERAGFCHALALSGDGSRVAGSFDDLATTVNALRFTPDGDRLVSVSADTTGLVWDLSELR